MQTSKFVCALSKLAQSITNMARRKTEENTQRTYTTWPENSEKIFSFDKGRKGRCYHFSAEDPIRRKGAY